MPARVPPLQQSPAGWRWRVPTLRPRLCGSGQPRPEGPQRPAPSPSGAVPAASKRDCLERFGPRTLERITRDDDVICTTEYSRIVPLENGEVGARAGAAPWALRVVRGSLTPTCCLQIVVSLVNRRPGAMNFSYSPLLRDFTKATNIRLRFLRTNTLLGHLMGKALRDPTVTRRVSMLAWRAACGAGGGMGGRRAGLVWSPQCSRPAGAVLLQHQGHKHWWPLCLPWSRRCL